MSSIPGYTLEAFVAWQWNLTVEKQGENNLSLGIAESLGKITPRPSFSVIEFDPLMKMYEPYRESIEDRLLNFDEDTQSWRMYAEYVDCDVPESVQKQAEEYVRSTIAKLTMTTPSGNVIVREVAVTEGKVVIPQDIPNGTDIHVSYSTRSKRTPSTIDLIKEGKFPRGQRIPHMQRGGRKYRR